MLQSLGHGGSAVCVLSEPRRPGSQFGRQPVQRLPSQSSPLGFIEIGRELTNNPCLYSVAQAHYQRHAAADDAIFAQYAHTVAPALRAAQLIPAQDDYALDRLFVTIAAADGTLPPVERINAIFRRYLSDERFESPDGLTIISFRDGTPYQGEDLYLDSAAPEKFLTRCTRPGAGGTPGMCLYEQRIGAASLTVRFPREWLADWRGLARAIDRLIAGLRPPPG